MQQSKPFQQCTHQKNEQLIHGMINTHDNENAFSMTSRIGKVCIETQNSFWDPDSCFFDDVNDGKVTENAISCHLSIACFF